MNEITSTALSAKTVSILGCGWLGFPLGQALVKRGFKVFGSTTQAAKLKTLRSAGLEPVLLRLDPDAPEGLNDLSQHPFFSSQVLVLNIPPSTPFGPDYHQGQIETLLRQLPTDKPSHVIFVSSISAFGPVQGEVSEATPSLEGDPSGDILQSAEARLAQAAQDMGFALTIVRAGGLVGHGRHPGRFLAGRKEVRDPEHAVNLIHQTDLVEFLARLTEAHPPSPKTTRLFVAVAPSHPTRRELYTEAARHLNLPLPEFKASTEETPSGHARGKIVVSRKINEETGHDFQFSDWMNALREGRL